MALPPVSGWWVEVSRRLAGDATPDAVADDRAATYSRAIITDPGGFSMVSPRRAAPFAAVLALGPLAMAAPAGARAARAGARADTIRVVEHANTDTEVPVAKGGKDEKGDPLTFTNPVFNAADTHRVGHDEGFCMRLNVATGTWECLWTTFLPGGQITVQGPFYDSHDSTLSITGGTGAYRDTRGQMKLHAFDNSKRYDFTFQLS